MGALIDSPAIADVLRAALVPLARRIDAAFLYGPAARPAGVAPEPDAASAGENDPAAIYGAGAIDLMVVGTALTFVELIPYLVPVEKRTGRKISLSIYCVEEFSRKLAARNIVVATVARQPKIFVVGSEETLPRAM